MKLQDTVKFMCSEDPKERLIAEYYQAFNRYLTLRNVLNLWDAKATNFIPQCPRSLYEMEVRVLTDYLTILETMAAMKHINLADYE